MIKANANENWYKEKKAAEKLEKENELRQKCEAVAISRYGSVEALVNASNKANGIWYLPALTEDGEVEKLLILRPIDRFILGEATSKMEDGGMMVFLETAMRSCTIEEHSDMDMFTIEEYFLSASTTFHKILDGKKTALVKR